MLLNLKVKLGQDRSKPFAHLIPTSECSLGRSTGTAADIVNLKSLGVDTVKARNGSRY